MSFPAVYHYPSHYLSRSNLPFTFHGSRQLDYPFTASCVPGETPRTNTSGWWIYNHLIPHEGPRSLTGALNSPGSGWSSEYVLTSPFGSFRVWSTDTVHCVAVDLAINEPPWTHDPSIERFDTGPSLDVWLHSPNDVHINRWCVGGMWKGHIYLISVKGASGHCWTRLVDSEHRLVQDLQDCRQFLSPSQWRYILKSKIFTYLLSTAGDLNFADVQWLMVLSPLFQKTKKQWVALAISESWLLPARTYWWLPQLGLYYRWIGISKKSWCVGYNPVLLFSGQ